MSDLPTDVWQAFHNEHETLFDLMEALKASLAKHDPQPRTTAMTELSLLMTSRVPAAPGGPIA